MISYEFANRYYTVENGEGEVASTHVSLEPAIDSLERLGSDYEIIEHRAIRKINLENQEDPFSLLDGPAPALKAVPNISEDQG